MADEITLNITLQVRNGNLDERTTPNQFNVDMAGTRGPGPGSMTIPIGGKVIDFSPIGSPGICWIQNIDDTNFVTAGVYDGARFYPVAEIGPGEFYPLKLSRYLNQEFVGTGTGTNADQNYFMLIADTASCNVIIKAFER